MVAVVVDVGGAFGSEIVAKRVRVGLVNLRVASLSSEMERFPPFPLLLLFLVLGVVVGCGTASASLLASFAGASDLFRLERERR